MKKASLLILCSLLWSSSALAQAPFYQGKTIRVIVGTLPGNLYDFWPRLIVEHMGKHIPGNPAFLVQNMPGAGHVVAVNHLYRVAKPEGLTLIGSIISSVYLNQLVGRSEVQFDWPKFSWIGLPTRGAGQTYMRADDPNKTIDDLRAAKKPARCGASRLAGPDACLPMLLQETNGAKFNIVAGYQGGTDIDLAVERGRIHCCAFTIETFSAREPYHTWPRNAFVWNVFQTGSKRDPRLPQTPTVFELMDQYKTPESGRRLAAVLLGAHDMGRPMFTPPGPSADRLKIIDRRQGKSLQI